MQPANFWCIYIIVWSFFLLPVGSDIQASSSATLSQDGATYWLEAECATVGNRWTKVVSDEAAGGAYVETQFVALASPPAATPENLIRFTVQDPPLTATYTLYARVDAPSPGNDSYWLRINGGPWQEIRNGFRIGQGFQWVRLTTTLLQGGTNTIDFTYRENSTRLDKILLTDTDVRPTGFGEPAQECPDVIPPPVDKGLFWLEAECATVGSTWMPERDAAASNGILVTSTRSSSRYQPPLDVPSNYIRFAFDDPELTSGGYRIWIRANLPDDNSDSFWIRFNGGRWSWRQPSRIRGKGLQWAGYPVGRNVLQAGRNTIDIAYGDTGIQLDKILVTKYSIVPSFLGGPADACAFIPAPTVSDRNTFWLEGECAEVGDAWTAEEDMDASNGTAVVVRNKSSTATPPADVPANLIRFDLPAVDSGTYNLFARVNAPNNLSDSYWVRANGGAWHEWSRGFAIGKGYEWVQLPTALSLEEGANTVDFAFRESSTLLDKVFLTLTAAEVSGDTLGPADPGCPSLVAPQAVVAAQANDPSGTWFAAELGSFLEVSLFPNPASNQLTIQLRSSLREHVLAIIIDSKGRTVRRLEFDPTDAELRVELDVSTLPAGAYHLRLLQNGLQTVRTFIKQ